MRPIITRLAMLVFCINSVLTHAQIEILADINPGNKFILDQPRSGLGFNIIGVRKTTSSEPSQAKQLNEKVPSLEYDHNGMAFEFSDDSIKERILEITSLDGTLIYRIKLPKGVKGSRLQIQHLVLENGYYNLNVLIAGQKEKFVFQIDRK